MYLKTRYKGIITTITLFTLAFYFLVNVLSICNAAKGIILLQLYEANLLFVFLGENIIVCLSIDVLFDSIIAIFPHKQAIVPFAHVCQNKLYIFSHSNLSKVIFNSMSTSNPNYCQ